MTKASAFGSKSVIRLCALLLLAVVAVAVSACGGSSDGTTGGGTTATTNTDTTSGTKPSGEPVSYGVVMPLTGPIGAAGKELLAGLEIAAEQINEEGGIDGRPFELDVEDSQGEVKPALEAASKLINVDKVPAVYGEYSTTVSLPLGQYVTRQGKLFMSGASSPEMGTLGPLAFGISPLDTFTAKVAAEDIYNKGYRKIAMLFPNSSYGQYIQKGLESSFKELGGTVTSKVLYQEGQSDYRADLSRLESSEPEMYVYGSYGEDAALINKNAFELGLHEDPWYGIYLTADIGEADPVSTEGQIGIDLATTGKVGKELTARFKEKTGSVPATAGVADTYDAAFVYAEAVERAGTTEPKAVAEAMLKTDRVGASGPISFNSEGERKAASFALVKAVDGEVETTQVLSGEG